MPPTQPDAMPLRGSVSIRTQRPGAAGHARYRLPAVEPPNERSPPGNWRAWASP